MVTFLWNAGIFWAYVRLQKWWRNCLPILPQLLALGDDVVCDLVLLVVARYKRLWKLVDYFFLTKWCRGFWHLRASKSAIFRIVQQERYALCRGNVCMYDWSLLCDTRRWAKDYARLRQDGGWGWGRVVCPWSVFASFVFFNGSALMLWLWLKFVGVLFFCWVL